MSLCEDKKRLLEVTWFTAAAISIAYVIAALVVASRLSKSDTPAATQPTAFAAIWSMILLVIILIGGSVVIKRIQTPIATGVFLGATAMFSQIELMLFTIFEARRYVYVCLGEERREGSVYVYVCVCGI
jgi:uncharacterized membrane protein